MSEELPGIPEAPRLEALFKFAHGHRVRYEEVGAQGGGLPKLANVKKGSPLSLTSEQPNSYEHITSYNNFYEFAGGAGEGPKQNSKNFKTGNWKIRVDGEVAKPADYQLEDFIKPYTLEETYEVLEAIDNRDWKELTGELGDLLLQVLFYSQMANEQGMFSIDEVLDRKLPIITFDSDSAGSNRITNNSIA